MAIDARLYMRKFRHGPCNLQTSGKLFEVCIETPDLRSCISVRYNIIRRTTTTARVILRVHIQ